MLESLATVPPMRTSVEGHSFGGQYWSAREYSMTATCERDRGTVTLEFTDSLDVPVITAALTAAEARALHDFIAEPAVASACGPLSLLRAPTVTFGDQASGPFVRLTDVEELCAWLRFALGMSVWDGDEPWEW